ncbi:DUF2254 domain-containing protein [Legionella impletisoli]|uniref:DUF2254 domain-containing protein n=1 Tax=Legionella impletisoli TaxID=343510 RepID=A0A917N9R4_9GAMM|nr:DUF2254 domain-containing protein [Legionella impletisoli]GGI75816.1 hypothetical protein GCM10007966_00800 [Legionella impletisoli]
MAILTRSKQQRLSLLLEKPWFLPVVICFVMNAIGVSLSLEYNYIFGEGVSITQTRQQTILMIMASSLMTLIGVTFSISMLILSSVATQYGPRLLPNFLHSKIAQFTLGLFLGTFIFCLYCIYYPTSDTIRGIQTVYAFILTITCLFILVIFINYVIKSIRIDGLLKLVVNQTEKAINLNYSKSTSKNRKKRKISKTIKTDQLVCSDQNGYIHGVDYETIKNIAQENDLRIHVCFKPGDYVYEKNALMRIYIKGKNKNIEKQISSLKYSINILDRRVISQDIEYGFDQIAEIAVRALSPGINDPYTARDCTFSIGKLLIYVDKYEDLEYNAIVEDKITLVTYKSFTYEGIIDAALSRLRQAAKDDVTIILAIYDMIINVAKLLKREPLRQAILNQAHELSNYIEDLKFTGHDQDAIKEREVELARIEKEIH